MTLVIVHYHLRPGGIRRVIEMATPHVATASPRRVHRVILATGETASPAWHQAFARSLQATPVDVVVTPAFRYVDEQRASASAITRAIRKALESILSAPDCVVWIHNPAVGRNLILARELGRACAKRNLPLVMHHHDWWFDHRWHHWPRIRASGFRTLASAANAVFPAAGMVTHAAINQADAAILARHRGTRARWLPNLTEQAAPVSGREIATARRWLQKTLGTGSNPLWVVPARTLRRKNLAEALLLTRWLRPEACLTVTGGPSSAAEIPYSRALGQAARRHRWPLKLGVLAGNDRRTPPVPHVLGACEAILFTSIQEGFGLPYLEAAAARKPLIARKLPNVMPDLARFGFRFPHAYDDILVPTESFDWRAERTRQTASFRHWRAFLPTPVRQAATIPDWLTHPDPKLIAFSRLSLDAQLEILRQPPHESWTACLPWNPWLAPLHASAHAGQLQVTPWPPAVDRFLGGPAYARRLLSAFATAANHPPSAADAALLQSDFIHDRLDPRHHHPLLWNVR